ncbi:helix-turn-helix transcriptional regulator [Anaeromyxobacter dehalogenans]|uniref:Transcriptional regulator, AraC family n=1 Tax=Anaeromyxobacter dehalogenans (strain 2CP-C) TaxID=290397 RepID=Q2IKS1_ANADE|nr:helix-turn-helix transcriptional regulator [Anaeromyxobacter dehalogenans]ABC82253.1 transcriptional regulator, AraC family [Anaeromyxobacter dehalogenans 2CP-C]
MIQRLPIPALRPFVARLWASEDADAAGDAGRERLLPTGAMHLAVRAAGAPVRVYDGPDDAAGKAVGLAVVGGARAAPYLRDRSPGARSVGAMLRPGAARLLFGAGAGELAGRHTALAVLWGDAPAAELSERLALARDPARRLDLLEVLLAARLPRVTALHPAVAEALARLPSEEVAAVVARTGHSHRHLVALFRDAVGLAPKAYARVLRFQRAAAALRGSPAPVAEIALACGYADQAHLGREFLALAGVPPARFRRLATPFPNHLPLGPSGPR